MEHANQVEESPQETCLVTLRGVTETALISLHARAWDAKQPNPILGDVHVQKVMDKLDYDFTKVSLPPMDSLGVVLRTRFFDDFTRSFLNSHPSSTILHLGCGLDTRALRIDWGSGGVCWADVDLPSALALRRQVVPTFEPSRDYRLIDANITEDAAWLDGIPADRPTAVVMEGLLSYLTEAERATLLSNLVEKFSEGEIITDCISPMIMAAGNRGRVAAVRQTGAEFQSTITDPRELEAVHPRLQYVETVRFAETPGLEMFPLAFRFRMYVLSWIPGARDAVRFVRYRILPRRQD